MGKLPCFSGESLTLPAWGDPFVAEWEAFYDSVQTGRPPKTGPDDFRQDLELFQEMVRLMCEPVPA